eukprot:SAG31_NODE_812_length_11915_cov_64.697360_10_plen_162_part_00
MPSYSCKCVNLRKFSSNLFFKNIWRRAVLRVDLPSCGLWLSIASAPAGCAAAAPAVRRVGEADAGGPDVERGQTSCQLASSIGGATTMSIDLRVQRFALSILVFLLMMQQSPVIPGAAGTDRTGARQHRRTSDEEEPLGRRRYRTDKVVAPLWAREPASLF